MKEQETKIAGEKSVGKRTNKKNQNDTYGICIKLKQYKGVTLVALVVTMMMSVGWNGNVGKDMGFSPTAGGFRPLVCLKSEVKLEKQSDGTYHIVDTLKSGKITFGVPVWEDNQASITVNTKANFQIEYQKDGVDGNWTKIENGGTITGLKEGDVIYARLTDGVNYGNYASVTIVKTTAEQFDREIEVGNYIVTIPAGAAISEIKGEYESVENGLVIYITNKDKITNWDADLNSNGIPDVQENYDQFVWIPVDKDSVIIEEGKEITGSTDEEKYESLKTYVSSISSPANEPSKYPMAVKKLNGEYSGILYDFTEENGTVKVNPKDYTTTSSYREPDEVDDDSSESTITKESLQEEYKTMIERVESKGGFWVGRYETSNMNSSNFKKNAVNVVRGTTNGINRVTWYKMYKGQEEYKNSEENTSLKNSGTTSSMIWGSQWDQIMIWMKEVKNTINTSNGQYYITNAVGMGNYGAGDSDTSTSDSVATGKREEYKVKNIYDLAGNVYDWTLETNNTNNRVLRGGNYSSTNASYTKASYRYNVATINSGAATGSRFTLY